MAKICIKQPILPCETVRVYLYNRKNILTHTNAHWTWKKPTKLLLHLHRSQIKSLYRKDHFTIFANLGKGSQQKSNSKTIQHLAKREIFFSGFIVRVLHNISHGCFPVFPDLEPDFPGPVHPGAILGSKRTQPNYTPIWGTFCQWETTVTPVK